MGSEPPAMTSFSASRLMILARGETPSLMSWLGEASARGLLPLVCGIVCGCGVYGASIGLGRAPLMAVFVAVKMPLLIFLTLGVNGLINGMFGSLLGSGMAAAMLICLPSLYIFSALGGMEARLAQVAGLLTTMVALTALLLLGFAPVVWVFSQSTESVVFMGFLTLVFWMISLVFGVRLLISAAARFGVTTANYVVVWVVIFFVVSLQMSTSLRPIVGTAETFLPAKKKFFMQHWLDEMDGADAKDRGSKQTGAAKH